MLRIYWEAPGEIVGMPITSPLEISAYADMGFGIDGRGHADICSAARTSTCTNVLLARGRASRAAPVYVLRTAYFRWNAPNAMLLAATLIGVHRIELFYPLQAK